MKQLIITTGQLKSDLDQLDAKSSVLSNSCDTHEEVIRRLEAVKLEEFKSQVNNQFAQSESRLGQGGDNIITEVQTLRSQLDSLSLNIGTASSQLLQLRQGVNNQQSTLRNINTAGTSVGGGNNDRHRSIMEYKAIGNLRPLKSKGEYRLWNDRSCSALEQAKPGLGKLFEKGSRKLDVGAKPMTIRDMEY